ncbi:DUF4865 domain-containing protein [Aliidongia dinghuensis]|uniref:DUF4865 domain-containing protein n=1 Tax=Aliidongia dinghuensis TaxID=1867774 RepID=A0A8J3E7N0_9PROT|nr:DUF4865 family protein [Aliidongia dinghuensis]GGF45577.1 DUF4865 domain-containing protein [Aliidongia dinghuensis]
MFAMQYEITLPADYDMAIIRRRVAERGHLLDDFAGLGLKTYLICERGKAGSEVNQYAPFYLWPRVESLWPFVAGPGFKGLTESFGWVAIRSWAGLDIAIRPDFAADAVAGATRQRLPVAPGTDLATLRRTEAERQDSLVARPDGPLLHATALDLERWELLRFALWRAAAEPPDGPVQRYQVLHLSCPDMAHLKGSTAPFPRG